jgi:endonuclease YncB( thermonuclease family)
MKLFQSIAKSALVALLGLSISAIAFEGKVVDVSDGDTITVLDGKKEQHKIRVAGIDAPEKGQDFGSKAKEHLSDLVYDKTVSLPDAKIEKYGRTVSRVLVGNKDAGLEMIKAGMAL